MTKKFLAVSAMFLAVSASSAFAEEFKGTVTDSMCSVKHVAGTKDDVACAEKCMKMGDKAVLVVGDKVYKVTNPETLVPHAGHQVTVEGTVKGDSLTVESVKM